MNRLAPKLVLTAALASLAGCPAPAGLTLFVAPVNGESNVRLVDIEPNPF